MTVALHGCQAQHLNAPGEARQHSLTLGVGIRNLQVSRIFFFAVEIKFFLSANTAARVFDRALNKQMRWKGLENLYKMDDCTC
jgi:hypothetical protein